MFNFWVTAGSLMPPIFSLQAKLTGSCWLLASDLRYIDFAIKGKRRKVHTNPFTKKYA